jgi:hypothetical protein
MSFKNPDAAPPPLQLPLDLSQLTAVAQAAATGELRELVLNKAEETADNIGFGWRASHIEHPSCHELNRRIAFSATNHSPLLIPDEKVAETILQDPNAEAALRFWRSVTKFRQRSCRCDVGSELRCDVELVDQAVLAEVSAMAAAYLHGYLVGTTLLRASGYGMSIRPREYVLDVLMFGFPEAILMEIERREDARQGMEAAA